MPDLAMAMKTNPDLKILLTGGYFDRRRRSTRAGRDTPADSAGASEQHPMPLLRVRDTWCARTGSLEAIHRTSRRSSCPRRAPPGYQNVGCGASRDGAAPPAPPTHSTPRRRGPPGTLTRRPARSRRRLRCCGERTRNVRALHHEVAGCPRSGTRRGRQTKCGCSWIMPDLLQRLGISCISRRSPRNYRGDALDPPCRCRPRTPHRLVELRRGSSNTSARRRRLVPRR